MRRRGMGWDEVGWGEMGWGGVVAAVWRCSHTAPWKFIAWNKSPHGAYSNTRIKAHGS